jgi:hypothetical protein
MKKTFYLCVGAQKSGTTWLSKYLAQYSNFNFGKIKEYHIWDGIYLEECQEYKVKLTKDLIKFKSIIPLPSPVSLLRYYLQNFHGAYENYFSSLIKNDINATGDFTPSYSGLSEIHFREIKTKLESVGFEVKVIFLMRDPYERCWSAVRMNKRNDKTQADDSSLLQLKYQQPHCIIRTNYKHTILELEKVFDTSNIYYGIYEEMFSPKCIEQISAFCKVAPNFSFTGEKFNISPKSEEIPIQLKSEIIDFYKDVYDFCEIRFPQVSTLWKKN